MEGMDSNMKKEKMMNKEGEMPKEHKSSMSDAKKETIKGMMMSGMMGQSMKDACMKEMK